MKTPEGESKQAVLGNGAGGEEYVKHLNNFFQYAEKLGHEAKLEAAEKANQAAYRILKKIRGEKPQDKESPTGKTERLKKVEVAKEGLEKAKTAESTIVGPPYDLFRKLLRDDPETQWD